MVEFIDLLEDQRPEFLRVAHVVHDDFRPAGGGCFDADVSLTKKTPDDAIADRNVLHLIERDGAFLFLEDAFAPDNRTAGQGQDVGTIPEAPPDAQRQDRLEPEYQADLTMAADCDDLFAHDRFPPVENG